MTILSPSYTLSREQFFAFRTTFRARSAVGNTTSHDIVIYNLIRELPISRGFTPITNQNKLANGATPNQQFDAVISHLKFLYRRHPDTFKGLFGKDISDEQAALFASKL